MTADDLRSEGYDREDEHFKRQEREQLDQLRQRLAEHRQKQQADNQAADHWLRCCKCGGVMQQIEYGHVMVDRCENCGGIHLDADELELLINSNQPQGLLSTLKRLLH